MRGAAGGVGDECGQEGCRVGDVGVGLPGLEGCVEHGFGAAGVDAVVVEVPAQGGGVAVAEGEGGGLLAVVDEAQHLVEFDGAVHALQVREYAAGADGGQLAVVAEQADGGASGECIVDELGQGEGVGHSCLVHDDQRRRIHAMAFVVVEVPEEFGDGGGVPCRLCEERGCGSRRRQAEDGAAGLLPGPGEDSHRGRLPRARGGQPQLQLGTAGGHGTHQACLPVVEGDPVGHRLQQSHLHRVISDSAPAAEGAGCDDPPLGVEHGLGGVEARSCHLVHRGPVAAPQLWRLFDPVPGGGQRDRGCECSVEKLHRQELGLGCGAGEFAGTSGRLTAQMPHLPGSPRPSDPVHHFSRHAIQLVFRDVAARQGGAAE